ncbi:MAG TPA: hypothetical protein DD856_09700 [Sulfobacillus sp.]|jgi:hypothetical protein|nr:hypothetical protein [Sulfobacillus sp.]
MKEAMRFIGHLFFEDKRIPLGVATAMITVGLIHPAILQWTTNVVYLGIIGSTLTVSVLGRS